MLMDDEMKAANEQKALKIIYKQLERIFDERPSPNRPLYQFANRIKCKVNIGDPEYLAQNIDDVKSKSSKSKSSYSSSSSSSEEEEKEKLRNVEDPIQKCWEMISSDSSSVLSSSSDEVSSSSSDDEGKEKRELKKEKKEKAAKKEKKQKKKEKKQKSKPPTPAPKEQEVRLDGVEPTEVEGAEDKQKMTEILLE